MGIDVIKELFERSDSSGSKSTILKPLTWLISILIGGLLLLNNYDKANWLVIFFVIIISLGILMFFFVYIFCLFKDRDALRSEKFSIQKMAIEKGLYGDNISGLFLPSRSKELEQKNSALIDNNEEEGEAI